MRHNARDLYRVDPDQLGCVGPQYNTSGGDGWGDGWGMVQNGDTQGGSSSDFTFGYRVQKRYEEGVDP